MPQREMTLSFLKSSLSFSRTEKVTNKDKKPSVCFYTLGCRVNQYETRAIEEQFEKSGFEIVPFGKGANVYVVNTCTVTGESDRKSRQIIRRCSKLGGENALIFVCGCMSQTNKEAATKIEGVTAVFGSADKLQIVPLAKELLEKRQSQPLCFVKDIYSYDKIEDMSVSGSDNTRAFVKIVDGCENKCSYCIIPTARGKIRSKKICDIVKECENITNISGCREIVLTGIETAAFGKDTGENLCDLTREVSNIKGVSRIRFGSLEPTLITEDFVKALSDIPKVMPHFHLSLQSGSDKVLADMKRKYNTKMFYEKVCILRKYFKDVLLTTDIIVGFPNESEENFEETLNFVKKCEFSYVHIFPYSDRVGTLASKMDGKLSESVKHERVSLLSDVMLKTREKILSQYIGKEAQFLCETSKGGFYSGYTENYIEVKLPENCAKLSPNDIVKIKLCDISENCEYILAQLV